MAVTGTGTFSDPYIVHDYDELESISSLAGTTRRYIKLGNDISGLNVPVWNLYNGYSGGLDINLNGHAIKDVTLDFAGNDRYDNCNLLPINREYINGAETNTNCVHDGRIINISFANICQTAAIQYFNFRRVNFGISCTYKFIDYDLGSDYRVKGLFQNCRFEKCTGVITAHFNNYTTIIHNYPHQFIFEYSSMYGCDFVINMPNVNFPADYITPSIRTIGIWHDGHDPTINANVYTFGCNVDCCRIRGMISGQGAFKGVIGASGEYKSSTTTSIPAMNVQHVCNLRNIASVDFSGCTRVPALPDVIPERSNWDDAGMGSWSVTNSDTVPEFIRVSASVTGAEMCNSAVLESKYIPVTVLS